MDAPIPCQQRLSKNCAHLHRHSQRFPFHSGEYAANALHGGSGADRLTGGSGEDYFNGGAGSDRFDLNDANPFGQPFPSDVILLRAGSDGARPETSFFPRRDLNNRTTPLPGVARRSSS
jgi:hypothetical protein